MSVMAEIHMEAMEQAEQMAEAELYYAILDALQSAKNLGLNKDHLTTLCYCAGVNLEDLED